MHISAIQNYYTKTFSQPLKPQKAQGFSANSTLSQPAKDTVSFSGWFSKEDNDAKAAAKAEAARRERYGNSEISKVAPEIIKVAKERLDEMGFKDINEDEMHIIIEKAPYDNDRESCHIISYYDKKQQASVRFTNDGDLAFMAKYIYSPQGEILEHYFYKYYDFNTKKWHDISRQTSLLIP